jgi:nitric oxide dioxygenase
LNQLHQAELAQRIVEATPDAIIFADVDGVIRLWNAGATRIFGFTAEEMVGQSMDAIIPERLRQRHWDGFHAAMASGTSKYGADQLLAVPAMRKDGTRISIEFTIALIRDDAGRLQGPAAIIRDVSAKFQETNELRRRVAELEAAQRTAEPA